MGVRLEAGCAMGGSVVSKRRSQNAVVVSLLVIIVWLLVYLSRGDRPLALGAGESGLESTGARTEPRGEVAASPPAKRGIFSTTAPPPKKYEARLDAGRKEYWEDDEVIKAAKEMVLPAMRAMEKKNAKVLFEKDYDYGHTVGISLSAPTLADLSEIATKMTQAIAAVPADRQTEVREKLYHFCNDYTKYPGEFRVVEVMRLNATGKYNCSYTELKDLSEVVTGENGSANFTRSLGSGQFTGDQWRERYGHLYDWKKMEEK
jgi:hypothetical protein